MEAAVYVTRIRNCSVPLPIDSVKRILTGASDDVKPGKSGPRKPAVKHAKINPEYPLPINDKPTDPNQGTLVVKEPNFNARPDITYETVLVSEDEFRNLTPRSAADLPTGHSFENNSSQPGSEGNQRVHLSEQIVKDLRDLEKFIEMLESFRTLVESWEVTSLCRTDVEAHQILDDVVTSFPTMEGRYRWYLVPEGDDGARPRYVAWIKIKMDTHCVYLIEMELKNEPGRSTLCVTPRNIDGAYPELSEEQFCNLLSLTAIYNGWPPSPMPWKDTTYEDIADSLFKKFSFARISHPYVISKKKKNQKLNEEGNDSTEDSSTTTMNDANQENASDASEQADSTPPLSAMDWAIHVLDSLKTILKSV